MVGSELPSSAGTEAVLQRLCLFSPIPMTATRMLFLERVKMALRLRLSPTPPLSACATVSLNGQLITAFSKKPRTPGAAEAWFNPFRPGQQCPTASAHGISLEGRGTPEDTCQFSCCWDKNYHPACNEDKQIFSPSRQTGRKSVNKASRRGLDFRIAATLCSPCQALRRVVTESGSG